uniref:Phospholipid phosphatase-related protein type 3 n=1 Tax=Mola mola TaxID=94237 RepID=A0A3Q3W6Q9_MOLML
AELLPDLPILVSSAVSLYFLEWTDVFKPAKSGFNCHDRSLSLPYIDPSHEVVPIQMLLSLAFAGPAITVTEANINAAGCNFNSFIRRAVRFIGVHAFGLCATALVTDILQLMTGYPTPYFLTVCKPNYTTLNVSCEQNPYIMEDICSGADPAAIIQGRKSFPSQHATLASFAAIYASMYFNSTLTDSAKLLKPLLVFSFIICAIICGLTRIIQYKNHAIDVYLGFLLGSAIAVYLVRAITRLDNRALKTPGYPNLAFIKSTKRPTKHTGTPDEGRNTSKAASLYHMWREWQRNLEGFSPNMTSQCTSNPATPSDKDRFILRTKYPNTR